jgi:hypothetical protein
MVLAVTLQFLMLPTLTIDFPKQTVLEGFRGLTGEFWAPPWVFDQRGSPVRALHNAAGQTRSGPLQIQLDDGSRGTLRVESKPCADGDDCEPFDCGCPLKEESYWIEIVNARGERVSRLHLWAAHGIFDIVPVDLVDGPGEELIIIRIPAHASPPAGHDVKIWKLGQAKPVELLEPIAVAGLFETELIGCARWRTNLVVDLASAKPRAVALRADFAARAPEGRGTAACRLNAQEVERQTSLKRGDVLRFEGGRLRRRPR